jgi:hypothetical protein
MSEWNGWPKSNRDDINKLADWMIKRGYATGHGETMEDLLAELDWQIVDNWTRAMMNGVLTEREACAKACEVFSVDRGMIEDEILKKGVLAGASMCAFAIRERGAP